MYKWGSLSTSSKTGTGFSLFLSIYPHLAVLSYFLFFTKQKESAPWTVVLHFLLLLLLVVTLILSQDKVMQESLLFRFRFKSHPLSMAQKLCRCPHIHYVIFSPRHLRISKQTWKLSSKTWEVRETAEVLKTTESKYLGGGTKITGSTVLDMGGISNPVSSFRRQGLMDWLVSIYWASARSLMPSCGLQP